MQELIRGDALAAWCTQWLGAQLARVLFEVAHLSRVTGLELVDGREVPKFIARASAAVR